MCEVTSWQAALVAGWAILEFWLGRTSATDAGSTLELILNLIKQLLALILPFLGGGAMAARLKGKGKGK